tara:strand:- start:113 stop:700 length:588 start_codon:yes stop_codon:yes gene_type:complete
MWLLSFIPTDILRWAVHIIVLSGFFIYIASFFFPPYQKIISILSIILLIFGVYCEGGYLVEEEWRLKVSALEEKLVEAETKSAVVNTVVQTKIVEKIKVVKETTNANVQVVEKIVTKYDNMCTLSNAAIVLHNSASQNVVAPSSGATVEGTSDVKASELVKAVAENYGLYYQVREQVLGWQMWYSEQKKVFESVK